MSALAEFSTSSALASLSSKTPISISTSSTLASSSSIQTPILISTSSALASSSAQTPLLAFARQFLALREGLLLAKFHNFHVQISPNSSNPVSGDDSFIIFDIRFLFPEISIGRCQAIPKSGNVQAHNLASMASSSVRKRFWLDSSSSL
ncbi:hypothetical protein Dsin_025755 [Dipteronia sinensis]|uniref:Uncharacterized protein n=1 Tax=Dipteronia sinensis TaxID=43782 RepID=A0AAE0DX43_9ROSI|nr:hypothetical protein Dsin_025755 [Dipteronia sinensis]